MSENGETAYNNTNRAFLQTFIARSTLTFDEAKPILAAIFTAHGGKEVLPDSRGDANLSLYREARGAP